VIATRVDGLYRARVKWHSLRRALFMSAKLASRRDSLLRFAALAHRAPRREDRVSTAGYAMGYSAGGKTARHQHPLGLNATRRSDSQIPLPASGCS